MTIFLPNDIAIFRSSFDSTCKRIIETKLDHAFCKLLFELITHLRNHSLLKENLFTFTTAAEQKKQQFNVLALEAIEDQWKRFWIFHPKLHQRKKLVRAKQAITRPNEFSFSTIYSQIIFKMREFYYYSPFSRVARAFQKTLPELNVTTTKNHHFSPDAKKYFAEKKLSLKKIPAKKKLKAVFKWIPNNCWNLIPFKWAIKFITGLLSPKIEELQRTFFIPGNSIEKRQNMKFLAETDPVYCWERLQFFSQCYDFNNTKFVPKPIYGKWKSIREIAWQNALERNNMEVLFGANMALRQKLNSECIFLVESFIALEHQFHRKDFEEYLKSFQNYIHNHLFILENQVKQSKIIENEARSSEDLQGMLPGTQKWNFVVDLASKYWKDTPLANHDEVFGDYLIKCPTKPLSRARWDQIIRERKLDPRPKEAKKRGKGKKTLQN